jgi:hypothetical protein
MLDHFHVTAADVPVVICRGDAVLKNPSNAQIAECLGFNDAVDQSRVNDLVIVGAGPAGTRRCRLRRVGRDSMCWSSNRARREARPDRAPGSRTTSAFQPASPDSTSQAAPTPRRRSSAPRS